MVDGGCRSIAVDYHFVRDHFKYLLTATFTVLDIVVVMGFSNMVNCDPNLFLVIK